MLTWERRSEKPAAHLPMSSVDKTLMEQSRPVLRRSRKHSVGRQSAYDTVYIHRHCIIQWARNKFCMLKSKRIKARFDGRTYGQSRTCRMRLAVPAQLLPKRQRQEW